MSTQNTQPVASSSTAPTPVSATEAEIDKLLSREATAFQRDAEVERILKAFKLKCVLGETLSVRPLCN
jgi:DnaJ family protein C protein 8